VQHITPEEAVAHIQALIDANHARSARQQPAAAPSKQRGATAGAKTTPKARAPAPPRGGKGGRGKG
jgi:hypothetical protein